jgi:protein-arginine kinase activator protein McsA
MREAQNNRCYICNSGPANNQSLHVDHDHITGKVRKLLCNNCNNGIGKLKDSIEILNKAIKYLKEHG